MNPALVLIVKFLLHVRTADIQAWFKICQLPINLFQFCFSQENGFVINPIAPKKFLQNDMIVFLKMDVELYEPKKYYVKSLFPPAALMVKK